MSILTNEGTFSASENRNNIIEYSYGFPLYPASNTTLAGVLTTQLANNIVTGAGTSFDTTLVAGDVVKIYSPLFNEDYQIQEIEDDRKIILRT